MRNVSDIDHDRAMPHVVPLGRAPFRTQNHATHVAQSMQQALQEKRSVLASHRTLAAFLQLLTHIEPYTAQGGPAMNTLSPRSAPADRSMQDDSIEARARRLLHANHHFRGRSDGFVLRHEGDVLTIQGAVRSFYLKQLIQTILSKLQGVRQINNEVQVAPAHRPSGGRRHGHGGSRFRHWLLLNGQATFSALSCGLPDAVYAGSTD